MMGGEHQMHIDSVRRARAGQENSAIKGASSVGFARLDVECRKEKG